MGTQVIVPGLAKISQGWITIHTRHKDSAGYGSHQTNRLHQTPVPSLKRLQSDVDGGAVDEGIVADPLYLSLWFPSFDEQNMMAHALAVLRQFPFSAARPGVAYLAVHPVSWNEPTILERRFPSGVSPEDAINVASDLLHEDYAYMFDLHWDLWILDPATKQWTLAPSRVQMIVQGEDFDEGAAEGTGQIEFDFGLDTPFLQEQVELNAEAEDRVRTNVHKLVDFTNKIEQNAHANGRLLWSDSEDNLAQKLIARLQKVQ